MYGTLYGLNRIITDFNSFQGKEYRQIACDGEDVKETEVHKYINSFNELITFFRGEIYVNAQPYIEAVSDFYYDRLLSETDLFVYGLCVLIADSSLPQENKLTHLLSEECFNSIDVITYDEYLQSLDHLYNKGVIWEY